MGTFLVGDSHLALTDAGTVHLLASPDFLCACPHPRRRLRQFPACSPGGASDQAELPKLRSASLGACVDA